MSALDDYLERVASMPCVLCWKKLGKKTYPVEVHHLTVPRRNYVVAPLCREHHQGATGVHGLRRRGFETLWKVDAFDLVDWTNEALQRF